MNTRYLIMGVASFVGLVLLAGIAGQRRELALLRSEQQAASTSDSQGADDAHLTAAPRGEPDAATDPQPFQSPSPELLRLRSQVTQLMDRKRELEGARAENEKLRAQIATQGTNPPAGGMSSPGYFRKRDARWVGAATPEDTLQSFLWAVQNHDLTNMVRVLTPESGRKLMEEVARSRKDFFAESESLPGLGLSNLQKMEDGSMEADIEMVPGEVVPGEKFHFHLIDGQWRLDMP